MKVHHIKIRIPFVSAAVIGALLFLSFRMDDYVLVKSIPFSNASFTTDNLGNAYVIAENQLFQFDSQGKPKATYSEANLGMLRSVDASNPMKILLYYPDFAQINILNSKLALQSTINLRPIGITQPTLICNSYNEGYWVFDLQDFQLKKIDLNLQVKSESGNINQDVGYTILPNFLLEADNFVYLNNPATGILVFDLYGTYYKTIPVKNLRSFQVIGDEILFVDQNRLKSFHLKKLEEREILLPPHDSLVGGRLEPKELFLLTTASLNFYSF
ncbi:MAG: hypothetical protein NT126_06895 [Bacteroidetes bacterium]|nr:hypothetical protein [Bacteroidota bacterium]